MAHGVSTSARWWVGDHGPISAAELLSGVESGRWSLDAPLRARPGGKPRELRYWLRELVLSSYADDPVAERDDVYRVAFERADVGLVVSDVRGQLLAVNDAFAALLGFRPDEMQGQWVADLSGPDPEERERRLANDAMAGRSSGYTIEKQLRHRDGHLIPVLVAIGLSRSDKGAPTHAVASVLDLRGRRAEESRERAEESLSAIQLLARGVAHDVSNLLAAIQVSVDGLREERQTLRSSEDVETIDLAAVALARLVSQLKRLALSGQGETQRCDLVHQLRARLPLLSRLLTSGQELALDLPDGKVEIDIDATGLEQLLLNLVVNASQAMDHGQGTVTLRVRQHAETVELAVEDEGEGMPDYVRRRAMEPFFTTKPDGSGLGLAIVHAVMVRSSARLVIERGLERGTVMRALFPRADLSRPNPSQTPRPKPSPACVDDSSRVVEIARARVLLVDDDALIRRVFGRVLRRTVAEVEVVPDGAAALARLRQAEHLPDVVITDFAMPNMNGVELAEQVAQRWPGVPVVMITAYQPSGLDELLRRGVVREALSKPVELPAIAGAVERALRPHDEGGAEPPG